MPPQKTNHLIDVKYVSLHTNDPTRNPPFTGSTLLRSPPFTGPSLLRMTRNSRDSMSPVNQFLGDGFANKTTGPDQCNFHNFSN